MSREENAKSPEPSAAPFPLRALWAWPLGCAVIGVVGTLIQFGRIGGGVGRNGNLVGENPAEFERMRERLAEVLEQLR